MSAKQTAGSITLILGPMFSGKTSELLRYLNRARLAGKKCIVIKYTGDTRYDVEQISTHDHIKVDSHIICDDLNKINYDTQIIEYDVICIDEASFIKNIHIVDDWANKGKKIYISALDANYLREPFPTITNLISKSENVVKLKAIFKCRNDAEFTNRKIVDTNNDKIEIIGGCELYESLCRVCFNKAHE